jgi:CubicO group peptidase (beta-lactamase class C family)
MTANHLDPTVNTNVPLYFPGAGHGFGLGFRVRTEQGVSPNPGSVGEYSWDGLFGTLFWVDPRERLIGIVLTQQPGQITYLIRASRALMLQAVEK